MAKKGGAQQLQAEINTDEELYKFLEKDGLLVMDVYSEWCGPCLAMVGSLRKIKLEIGGDNLHLAICKSDTIDVLERFRNKSEPTWLFATRRKLVNLMFGSDVPKLMALIEKELSLLGTSKRTFYDITEMQPEEKARRDVIQNALAEARRIEIEEAARKKQEYLNHVTNEIMANLPDIGVTIFGPHVQRDAYKKLMEIAEEHKIACKDRRTLALLPEHIDIINYACQNPIDPEVLEHMYNKDVLTCFWKASEASDKKPLEDIFLSFAHDLTHSRKPAADDETEEAIPPLLTPLEIKLHTKLEGIPEKEEIKEPSVDDAVGELLDSGEGDEHNAEGEEGVSGAEKVEAVPSVASSDAQIILVPAIWVPTDRRTHATLIYVLFRPQTISFLEPDPVPDPPHVIMAFDAYKRRDIFEVIAKYRDNVLLYGFFTNDDPDTATLIADSVAKYQLIIPQTTDKLILKVAKKTSHTMLAFASYGPSYVSTNTVLGKEEALKLFPEGFVNNETPAEDETTTKKKKKDGSPAKEKGDTGEGTAEQSSPES